MGAGTPISVVRRAYPAKPTCPLSGANKPPRESATFMQLDSIEGYQTVHNACGSLREVITPPGAYPVVTTEKPAGSLFSIVESVLFRDRASHTRASAPNRGDPARLPTRGKPSDTRGGGFRGLGAVATRYSRSGATFRIPATRAADWIDSSIHRTHGGNSLHSSRSVARHVLAWLQHRGDAIR